MCHVERHGQFTLKQLILDAESEMHTNSSTGPILFENFALGTMVYKNEHT